MAKVSGSYPAVTRGVSEQVPQDRRPGQHYEQVNMISDPVRGLARRHGSVMLDERIETTWTAPKYAEWLTTTLRSRVFPFFVNGVEYDLIYRTTAPIGSGVGNFAWCFNKATSRFIPVTLHADTATLQAGGISAAVNVGRYVFLGGHNIVPGYTPTDKWGATANRQKMVVWVMNGAYSRTFKVTLRKTDNSKVTVSYTTKKSSYPILLDTSDILATDPEYQTEVNKRIADYNSKVTEWIGIAAQDITPQNIAQKLADALVALGITATAQDGNLCIDDALYTEVYAEDGGDGSMLRAVGAEVPNIDLVSLVHYPGKIVKVRPKKNNGEDTLYLQAVAKEGVTSFGEVTWRECAGYEMLPTAPFCMATVKDNVMYIAATPSTLDSLTGETAPTFKVNSVGDDITCPLPYFVGKRIDYLGLFQDRLAIGSGAVIFFSKPGDYFNWFRGSVLSVQDNDPVEQFALGSEDDTIVSSTTYDKNLVLFGKRNQYAINGRAQVSLKNPIFVMSSHEDAVDAPPVSSGNFVFYAKGTENGVSSAHQIQVGNLADSPESYQVSQQLDRYIKGRPVELLAVTAPNCVFFRTDGARNTLYTYAYLDTANGSERLFDSWSRWEWNALMGDIIGLGRSKSNIHAYMLRHGLDKDGVHQIWVACEKFVLDTDISSRPYADSLRLTEQVLTPLASAFLNPVSELEDFVYLAYGSEDLTKRFLGTNMGNSQVFLEQYPTAALNTWAGLHFNAYVTPTNPYVRDQNGNAIVVGRLTVGRIAVTLANTGGMSATVTTSNGTETAKDFSGRILGRNTNIIGQQPIVNTNISVNVGKETREFNYTLWAKTFLPLTITAIEWVGQYFNNAKRV